MLVRMEFYREGLHYENSLTRSLPNSDVNGLEENCPTEYCRQSLASRYGLPTLPAAVRNDGKSHNRYRSSPIAIPRLLA
jgi:hypothetical protein